MQIRHNGKIYAQFGVYKMIDGVKWSKYYSIEDHNDIIWVSHTGKVQQSL